MSLDLLKWIRGWRLDLAWQKLINHPDAPLPPISVQEISTKTATVLTKALEILNSSVVLVIEQLAPDLSKIIDAVKAQIPIIVEKLSHIATIADIPEQVAEYRFSADDKENELYHNLVKSAALVFNDGSVSPNDVITILGIFKGH